ncbi:MAG TPA: xylose isomerase [Chitinophagaceae bacterium]|jgi:sugar phosphate isomerase/epimerase|nr:xylose isomerase [Chitinophagaceae bacterium]
MYNRRTFFRNSGALALGGLILSGKGYASVFGNYAMHPVGLQLYTLGGTIDQDVPGTLKKVAEIGYKDVESAFSVKGGYYGMTSKEFAKMTKDMGLSWVSHHTIGAPFKMPPGGFKVPAGMDTTRLHQLRSMPPMKNLKENYQQVIDEVAEGGLKYLVCASIPLGNSDEIHQAIDILNRSGEAAKKAGVTLCYHNHTHEFETVDGMVPYDMLLTQTSPDILKMELDLGWATKAGADPVELFKKNPGRFPLWHVKDISADQKIPTEIGNGTVDFKRIFAVSKESGMQYFFVEQDGATHPIESITASYKDLTTKILV